MSQKETVITNTQPVPSPDQQMNFAAHEATKDAPKQDPNAPPPADGTAVGHAPSVSVAPAQNVMEGPTDNVDIVPPMQPAQDVAPGSAGDAGAAGVAEAAAAGQADPVEPAAAVSMEKSRGTVIDEWFAEYFTPAQLKAVEREEWKVHEIARVSAAIGVLKGRLGL